MSILLNRFFCSYFHFIHLWLTRPPSLGNPNLRPVFFDQYSLSERNSSRSRQTLFGLVTSIDITSIHWYPNHFVLFLFQLSLYFRRLSTQSFGHYTEITKSETPFFCCFLAPFKAPHTDFISGRYFFCYILIVMFHMSAITRIVLLGPWGSPFSSIILDNPEYVLSLITFLMDTHIWVDASFIY